jgi:hypothetical protein
MIASFARVYISSPAPQCERTRSTSEKEIFSKDFFKKNARHSVLARVCARPPFVTVTIVTVSAAPRVGPGHGWLIKIQTLADSDMEK